MTTDIVPAEDRAQDLAVQAVVKGDLRKFTEAEKLDYIAAVCRSLGLNPLTRPFELLVLNGREVLYPTRGATDQLRTIRGITITDLRSELVGDVYRVTAFGRDRDGREDASTGAVSVRGLTGEAFANAIMKAETKAKRRLTLSLAGLGWPDESEIDGIPSEPEQARPSLAERIIAKAAEVVEQGEVETTEAPHATPEPIVQTRCADPSPYDDGTACGLPAGHLAARGASRIHRALDEHGAILASWPARSGPTAGVTSASAAGEPATEAER